MQTSFFDEVGDDDSLREKLHHDHGTAVQSKSGSENEKAGPDQG